MSNLRRDDCLYGMSWVRVAGPVAVCLYQAAEDYCHRMLSGATIPRAELEIALPWPLKPGELDAAIELLVRLGRFEIIDDCVFLPNYFLEQESDEDQKSSRAKQVSAGKARAETAKRDAKGRMVANQPPSSHRLDLTSQKLESGSSPPASGPGRAGPGLPSWPQPTPDPPPSEVPAPPSAPQVGSILDVPRGTSIVETPTDPVAATLNWLATVKPKTDADRVWRYYVLRFVIDTGAKPTQKQEHFIQINRLLKQHGVAGITNRIDTYFDRPPWRLREGSRDFGRFLKSFDELAAPGEDRIVRKLDFEAAGQRWLAEANGHAQQLDSELLKLVKGPETKVLW